MTPRPQIQLPTDATTQPIGAGRFVHTKATNDQALMMEWLGGYDGHTRRAYERIGHRFLEALDTPLRDAAVEDYRRAVDTLAIKPDGSEASNATKATYTATIKSFLGFAHQLGYIAFNAAPLIKVKKAQRDLAKRIISEIDIGLLITNSETTRERLLVEVGYYGGLRVSELVNLKWGDLIERDCDRLQIASLVGKGGKVREVLLPAGVSRRLRSCRGDAPANAFVFQGEGNRTSQHGGIGVRTALNIIKAIARRAGLSDAISPHWLRHAHISHALDNGAPVSLVSQSVGHADMKTTSIYAHARPGDSSGLYLKEIGEG